MPTKPDPYRLGQRKGGTPAPALRRAPTGTSDKAESSKGYIRVSPEFFKLLRRGTHIRYTKETPVPGEEGRVFSGFVGKADHAAKFGGKKPVRHCLMMQSNFAPKAVRWMQPHDEVGKLYARGDAVALALYAGILRSVKTIVPNMQRLADSYNRLEARTRAIEKKLGLASRR